MSAAWEIPDVLLSELARRALGGPGDAGRASYQVAVTRCDACQAVSIDAGGEHHHVDDDVAEMIACDSQEAVVATPFTRARGMIGVPRCAPRGERRACGGAGQRSWKLRLWALLGVPQRQVALNLPGAPG